MRIIIGDVFKSDSLVRCITTNGIIKKNGRAVMGAGNAKVMRDKYPDADIILANNIKKCGNVVSFILNNNGVDYYSFPTKHNWRDNSDIDLIRKSKEAIIKIADEKGYSKIAIPFPGISNGKLSIQDVYEVIADMDDRFYFYLLPSKSEWVWKRRVNPGEKYYEVSSKGDKRFSALYAKLPNGKTIEEVYQLDIKGYRKFSNDTMYGKGKLPINGISKYEQWIAYRKLWEEYFSSNPKLLEELYVKSYGCVITDMFATSDINQARAISEILTEYSYNKGDI